MLRSELIKFLDWQEASFADGSIDDISSDHVAVAEKYLTRRTLAERFANQDTDRASLVEAIADEDEAAAAGWADQNSDRQFLGKSE